MTKYKYNREGKFFNQIQGESLYHTFQTAAPQLALRAWADIYHSMPFKQVIKLMFLVPDSPAFAEEEFLFWTKCSRLD